MLITIGFALCQPGTDYAAMCEKKTPHVVPYCFDYPTWTGTFPKDNSKDWELSRGRPLFSCPLTQWTLCCVRKDAKTGLQVILKSCDNAPRAQGT
ncbi:hypothetical protein PSTT_00221 [Puccinia striiformis]|nr:hypothetical protein PSTT_00221 [Puccinia striiformis]